MGPPLLALASYREEYEGGQPGVEKRYNELRLGR
jgi:hypothetical protein